MARIDAMGRRVRRAGLQLTMALLLGPLLTLSAFAQIAVVGSPDLGDVGLNAEQAAQLFLGRRAALSDGTPITLVDLPAGPVRDHFYSELTGKNPSQIRAYWSRLVFTGRALPPREAASAHEARQWIATGRRLVGYLPESEVGKDVHVLLRLP